MKHAFPSKLLRLSVLILALVLVMGLTACSGSSNPEDILKGTVSADNLNVRKKHDPDSKILGRLPIGLEVEILEKTTVDNTDWGRIDEMILPDGTKIKAGWINLSYVDFTPDEPTQSSEPEVTEPSAPPPTEPVTIEGTMGTITAGELNIREAAGSKYDAIGSYYKGDRVEIQETVDNDGTLWGRTGKGWIGMSHVKMDGTAPSANDVTTNSKVTVTDGRYGVIGYGVVDLGTLNVRSGPGTGYDKLKEVSEGYRYAYYQIMDGWVRIEDGWVNQEYFYIEGTVASDAANGSVDTEDLNIRTGPGTDFKTVGTYAKGEIVEIMAQADNWGYTSKGWISMSHVTLAEPTYNTGLGTVTTGLNIRKEANADSESLGTYKEGDIVTILEVNGSWGKTDKGWINLKYVDFD